MKTLIAKILILAVLASTAAIVPNAYSQDKNPPVKKTEKIQQKKRDRIKKKDKKCTKKYLKKKHKHKIGNKRGGRK